MCRKSPKYVLAFLQIAIVITVTGDWVPEAESSAESVAREFVVVFPWNNGDSQYAPTVSLNLINPNDQEASVDLSYTTVAGLFGTVTLRVDPFGITKVCFGGNFAYTLKNFDFGKEEEAEWQPGSKEMLAGST